MSYYIMPDILHEIHRERSKQDDKWGEQNHPCVTDTCRDAVPDEDTAKSACDEAMKNGTIAWAHIAIEELAEVLAPQDILSRRAELVQLAAVIVAWIECIDRKEKK